MAEMIDEVSTSFSGNLSKPFREYARAQLVNACQDNATESRSEDRQPMLLPALVVAIDEFDSPLGDVREVVTRDVASTSIGLLHEQPLNCKRVALRMRLAGVDVNLVLQVVWQSDMGPFFGSAGWYVKKLSSFPAELPAHWVTSPGVRDVDVGAESLGWEGDIETVRRFMK